MNYIIGRNNFAATIYVPWDCCNNCEFCDSKKEYRNGTNFEKVLEAAEKINESKTIQEVVITGGEPCTKPELLMKILDALSEQTVYINSTVMSGFDVGFSEIVNHCKNVFGVNISRHAVSEELEKLKNISPDNKLLLIEKPIHINVVSPALKDIEPILKRWLSVFWERRNVTVCIRADFRKTTTRSLHDMDDDYMKQLCSIKGMRYIGHTSCNVCDTQIFKYRTANMIGPSLRVNYHRGLESTAVRFGDTIEVNDLVVFPDGTICYDWNRESTLDRKIGWMLNLKFHKINPVFNIQESVVCQCCIDDLASRYAGCGSSSTYLTSYCGSSGCGVRTSGCGSSGCDYSTGYCGSSRINSYSGGCGSRYGYHHYCGE